MRVNIKALAVLVIALAVMMGFNMASAQDAKDKSNTKAKNKVVSQEKAAEPQIPPNNSVITFDHNSFDYGVVPKGEQVTHHFPVTNTGSDTLTITKIKPGCGCTTTRKSSIVIAPGDTALIDITDRSSKSSKSGHKVTKRVRVHSTDSSNPEASLSISARTDTSGCGLRCVPEIADFGDVLIGKDDKFEVELKNIDTLETAIEIVSGPTSEYVNKYKIKKNKLKPGQSIKIEFQLRDDIPPGEFMTGITIENKNDSNSRISIPIKGNIVESLSVNKAAGKTQASSKTVTSDQKSMLRVDDTDLK